MIKSIQVGAYERPRQRNKQSAIQAELGKDGAMRVYNNEEFRQLRAQRRDDIIDKKFQKWQEMYGEIDNFDSFSKQEADLKKTLCANEILIKEQGERINKLEAKLMGIERRTEGKIAALRHEIDEKFKELTDALTRTFISTSRKKVNIFVKPNK